MGLDMYLTKKTYVKNWDHHKPEEKTVVTVERGGKKHPHIVPARVSHIEEEIGQWRKANAIHVWFVDNVQDGNDDCGEYSVSQESMEELQECVEKVLASIQLVDGVIHAGDQITPETNGEWEPILKPGGIIPDPSIAEELLPTRSGFFFGSTDYDEFYVADLKLTLEILERGIEDAETGEVYYSSSW